MKEIQPKEEEYNNLSIDTSLQGPEYNTTSIWVLLSAKGYDSSNSLMTKKPSVTITPAAGVANYLNTKHKAK